MSMHKWVDKAACLGKNTEMFFSLYEDDRAADVEIGEDYDYQDGEDFPHRKDIDAFCSLCPVQAQCLATGVSRKESGVWGGVYLDNGKISREFNSHKTKADWFAIWQAAAMESK